MLGFSAFYLSLVFLSVTLLTEKNVNAQEVQLPPGSFGLYIFFYILLCGKC